MSGKLFTPEYPPHLNILHNRTPEHRQGLRSEPISLFEILETFFRFRKLELLHHHALLLQDEQEDGEAGRYL
jgi:hypothetical protein